MKLEELLNLTIDQIAGCFALYRTVKSATESPIGGVPAAMMRETAIATTTPENYDFCLAKLKEIGILVEKDGKLTTSPNPAAN